MRKAFSLSILFGLIGSVTAAGQTTIYWKRDTIYAGPGGGAIATVTPPNSDTTAPSAPSSLGTTSTTATSVALSWTGSTDTGGSSLAGYKIYRQKGSGANLPVGTVNSSTTAFTDQPLEPGQSYFYTVVAFDQAQNHSSASNSVNPTTSAASTDTTAPSAPPTLTGQVLGSNSVKLNWLFSTDAGGSGVAGYRVKRGGSDVSGWLSASTLTYTDNSAPPNSSLTYTAEAKDGQGNVSSASNSVNVTTPADSTAPSVPTGLSATGQTSTSVRVSWTASSDGGGSGLAGYKVWRGTTLLSGSSPITGTSFDETGLISNYAYSNYTVKAVDNAGNLSGAAGPVGATTLHDTTAPTTPGGFTGTMAFFPDIYMWWTASTDSGGSGLAGYQVYFVENYLGTVSEYPITELDVPPDLEIMRDTTGWDWSYFVGFRVYAIDGEGNRSTPATWTP